MKIKIDKSKLKGVLLAPPSKSYAHRALIAASFANGNSIIKNIEYSNDIKATISCLKNLGVSIKEYDDYCEIVPLKKAYDNVTLDCSECGTTYRLMIPIVLALGIKAKLIGSKKLLSRPINVYEELFNTNVVLNNTGSELIVSGNLDSDYFTLRGNVSSQFVTGLLYACVVAKKKALIEVTKPIESKPYIDMTIDILGKFGVRVSVKSDDDKSTKYEVLGKDGFKNNNYTIEGDYSNTSFFEAMKDFSDIKIEGLNKDSIQGDKIYLKYFEDIKKGYKTIDIENCPDLAPILMVYACMHDGVKLINTRRLKIKESDRGIAMKEELAKCGIDVNVLENEIDIKNPHLQVPNEIVSSHNDHRIVMAMTVIGLIIGDTVIDGCEAVNKSYNNFFKQIKNLGGDIDEVDCR